MNAFRDEVELPVSDKSCSMVQDMNASESIEATGLLCRKTVDNNARGLNVLLSILSIRLLKARSTRSCWVVSKMFAKRVSPLLEHDR